MKTKTMKVEDVVKISTVVDNLEALMKKREDKQVICEALNRMILNACEGIQILEMQNREAPVPRGALLSTNKLANLKAYLSELRTLRHRAEEL